jgi:Sec-independent protein translocase protein TatA
MFGIGPTTELVVIVLLLVVVFGSGKAISMARDFGRFVSGAHHTVEEFKGELLSQEEIKEAHHTVEEFMDEACHSLEELEDQGCC